MTWACGICDARWPEAVPTCITCLESEREQYRLLLVESDSELSHMFYRGSWVGTDWEVERLIGRIRVAVKP